MNMKTPEQIERKRLYDIVYRKKNKELINERNKQWLVENKYKKKESDKQYYIKNKDAKKLYDITYRKEKAELKKANAKKYYQENKDRIKNQTKNYRNNNKTLINKRNSNRKANDPLYKLICDIRCLVKQSFKYKGLKKNSKTEQILGCSFAEFKTYIESKFEAWMNWENKGNPKDGIYKPNKTWDIDHIVKLSTANTLDEIIKLNHYSNLQPMCSYTNRWIKA